MVIKMQNTGIKLEELIAYDSREAIIQNLKDAGCSQETIECCLTCLDIGKREELLKRLENHRKALLRKIHETKFIAEDEFCPEEKQIDCLDYLVYQIDRCCCEKNQ